MKIKDVNRLSIEDLLILGEYNFETPELVFGNLKDLHMVNDRAIYSVEEILTLLEKVSNHHE